MSITNVFYSALVLLILLSGSRGQDLRALLIKVGVVSNTEAPVTPGKPPTTAPLPKPPMTPFSATGTEKPLTVVTLKPVTATPVKASFST